MIEILNLSSCGFRTGLNDSGSFEIELLFFLDFFSRKKMFINCYESIFKDSLKFSELW